jgi:uncharacterized protein
VRATLRFYAELNDFLAPRQRFAVVGHEAPVPASAKDVIEAHGVPHTEVDLVLANGESVDFGYQVAEGDRLAVYPVFEAFDVGPLTRVRPEPLRDTRFVLDVHLGRLARYLRLAGLDTRYSNTATDTELAEASARERRILLTRDQGLLKRAAVTHGHYVRETAPALQFGEVVRRFDLRRQLRPFTRCTCCNAGLEAVEKADVSADVPERSRRHFDAFLRCTGCRRVYWRGSHAVKLEQALARALRSDPLS